MAWALVAIAAAMLTGAFLVDPPPSGPLRSYGAADFFDHPLRPADALPDDVRTIVREALRAGDCATATDALISVYMLDHPQLSAARREEDYRHVWWVLAGQEVYQEAFLCHALERFREIAAAYAASGRTGFSWCGDLGMQDIDDHKDPLLFHLSEISSKIALLANQENVTAMRELVAADDRYAFVELDDVARYALLTRLSEQVPLAPSEEQARRDLAARLSKDAAEYVEIVDMGYASASRIYGRCRG